MQLSNTLQQSRKLGVVLIGVVALMLVGCLGGGGGASSGSGNSTGGSGSGSSAVPSATTGVGSGSGNSTVPSAPTGVTATATSSTQINLSWTAVTGAQTYYVYRATAPNLSVASMSNVTSGSSTVGSTVSTQLNDTYSLVAGTTYYYKVVALNATGAGAASTEVSALTPVAAVGRQMGGGRIAGALNLSTTVSSYPFVSMASCAGGPLDGNVLGSALSAPSFCTPDALTTDGVNLYVVDNWLLQPANAVIRKINLATGVTTSIAGSWSWQTYGSGVAFNVPRGITTDGTALYLADTGNHVIRKIDIATNATTTFAGTVPATVGGAGSFADGSATVARFNKPAGITTDGVSLFVADTLNRAIRKIDIATGVTSTLAGNSAGAATMVDGSGAAATFVSPTGITTDGTSLYVVDSNAIRVVGIASGAVVTLAGSAVAGFTDATAAAAKFNLPNAIATDGTNLYVTDNARVRKVVIASGVVTTLAGGGAGVQADGVGAAASFNQMFALGTFPYGITSDGVKVYVGDRQAIRKIQ